MESDTFAAGGDVTRLQLGARSRGYLRSNPMLLGFAVLGLAFVLLGWFNVVRAPGPTESNDSGSLSMLTVTGWGLALIGTLIIVLSVVMLVTLRRGRRVAAAVGPDGLTLQVGGDSTHVPWPHVERVRVEHGRRTSPVFADLVPRDGSPLATAGIGGFRWRMRRSGSDVHDTVHMWIGDLSGATLPPEEAEAALRRWAGERFEDTPEGA